MPAATDRVGRHSAGFLATALATPGHILFGLCMASLAVSFALFYALFKYKVILLGWIFCLGLFGAFWIGRAVRFRLSLAVLWPVIAFQGWLWLTAIWSYSPGETIWWVALDSLLPAVFLLSIAWAQNVSAWRLTWYYELTALLFSFLGLWFLVSAGKFVDETFGAVRSGMAGAFLAALPFLLWRLRLRPSPYRIMVAAWSILALLVVGSRSALVLLPVVLLASGAIALKTTRRPLSTVVIGSFAATILAASLLAVPSVRGAVSRGLERFSPAHQSLDVSAAIVSELGRGDAVDIDRRLQAYVALETFLESPVLGDGYMNTYMKVGDRFHREVSAHGLPFTLLAETGIVGTLLFAMMMWRFYQGAARYARGRAFAAERSFGWTLLLTLTSLLLFGLFHQVHQTPTFYVTLGWGYALAMSDRRVGQARHRAPVAAAAPPSPSPA